ncbi:hypothetical protein GCM10009680_30620 [Streptomyces yatensis]|uniref:Uncharacterized protein n=1 Tax=Streptomyces yatensis TaxID=155177 RepID=A0ABN2HJG7_9ACTN
MPSRGLELPPVESMRDCRTPPSMEAIRTFGWFSCTRRKESKKVPVRLPSAAVTQELSRAAPWAALPRELSAPTLFRAVAAWSL